MSPLHPKTFAALASVVKMRRLRDTLSASDFETAAQREADTLITDELAEQELDACIDAAAVVAACDVIGLDVADVIETSDGAEDRISAALHAAFLHASYKGGTA